MILIDSGSFPVAASWFQNESCEIHFLTIRHWRNILNLNVMLLTPVCTSHSYYHFVNLLEALLDVRDNKRIIKQEVLSSGYDVWTPLNSLLWTDICN